MRLPLFRLLAILIAVGLDMGASVVLAQSAAFKLHVGWGRTALDSVHLQTAGGGSVPFALTGKQYSLHHPAVKFGERSRLVIKVEGSSVAFPLYPSAMKESYGLNIDVLPVTNCSSDAITGLIRRTWGSEDIDALVSAIVQARLYQDFGCPPVERDRLAAITAHAGCKVADFSSVLAAYSTGLPRFSAGTAKCAERQRVRIVQGLDEGIKRSLAAGDFAAYQRQWAELSDYAKAPEWADTVLKSGAGASEIRTLYGFALEKRAVEGQLDAAATYSGLLAERAREALDGDAVYGDAFEKARLNPRAADRIDIDIQGRLIESRMAARAGGE